MKGEINRDFYCSAEIGLNEKGNCGANDTLCALGRCGRYHRKWPTPEQYKEEYGKEYPDDWAVYCFTFDGAKDTWVAGNYRYAKQCGEYGDDFIVCACTPWGKPPDDWRPECP